MIVLCPTLLPSPLLADPVTPIGVYTFPLCHALVKPRGCPLYDFAVLYGAPDESPGHGADNTPATFLHFELLGGRDVLEALGVHGLSGTRPLQHLIGARTIAGHLGRLYFGLPYNRGGGEYGSHYTFVWRQGRWRYAASLHSWRPHSATLHVLTSIIAHIAPRQAPTAADASLRVALPHGWDQRTVSGGLVAARTGVNELIAANFRLPATIAECEGGMPRLARRDALVRIYDYGAGTPMPPAVRPVRALTVGPIHTQHGRGPGAPAYAYTRFRYRGHLVVVDASFGARHPPRVVLRALRRLLARTRFAA